jgi:hypothetical protein
VAACVNSLKSPPRDPRDPPYHHWRDLVHTNHTRCTESRSGCTQRISGPPSDPYCSGAHASPGDDVVASVLWTLLTSSTSDLGDGRCKHRPRAPTAMQYSAIGTARSGVVMESPQGGAHAVVNS